MGSDVTLVTDRLHAEGHFDRTATHFLAAQANRASAAWEPGRPSPGTEYVSAMRETIVTALKLASDNYKNEITQLQDTGVQIVEGLGGIAGSNQIRVSVDGRVEEIDCRAIILATGSEPYFDSQYPCALTPGTLASMDRVPESMIVMGSSPSALEIARFFAAFGVQVTVVGARRPALDFLDRDLREHVTAQMEGLEILTEVSVVARATDGRVHLTLSDGSGLEAEYAFACGEGSPSTEGLELDRLGVCAGADGEILTDECMRTSVPGIFAVGSVTGWVTDSIATRQAEVAAENASGGQAVIRYDLIPAGVWFDPEITAVGMTEDEARARGISVTACAVCLSAGLGLQRWVKLLEDESTGRLIGLHAVGKGSVEMGHMGALAIHAGATMSDISEIPHMSDTMAECISTAASLGQPSFSESVNPLVSGPD